MNEYFRFRSAFAEEYARYRKHLVPLLQNGRQFNELIHLTVREKHGFTRDGIQAGIVEQLSLKTEMALDSARVRSGSVSFSIRVESFSGIDSSR